MQILVVALAAGCGWGAASASARSPLVGVSTTSLAYNQGITYDEAARNFFFAGVSSPTNSGLYRTDNRLRQLAGNTAVIPKTAEGYNHIGDLSFDSAKRRLLLPLECYYPSTGGNTCGTGAIGVGDPVTLHMRYHVTLARSQIEKVMWSEISPDGRWIWTSSGTHLLAYRAADISGATARGQRSGKRGGIVGVDLGPVLPTSSVTGATAYRDSRTRTGRLLLSVNLGARFEVLAFSTATAPSGRPKLLGKHPTTIVRLARSPLNIEPEGLATTGAKAGRYALGGWLHWQMLPTVTPSTAFARILTYAPR